VNGGDDHVRKAEAQLRAVTVRRTGLVGVRVLRLVVNNDNLLLALAVGLDGRVVSVCASGISIDC
jgi:hypothetical protein